jgi:hydroxymethylglutaryl-CoA reductase
MRLHARNVAASAGATPPYFERVVQGLIETGDIKVRKAKELLAKLRTKGETGGREVDDSTDIHGRASGKVILLGEHAAVYGRHALALPLQSAVTASLRECAAATKLEFGDVDEAETLTHDAPAGLSELVDLVVRQLGLEDRHFAIRLQSSIPRASGLGSSAAVAVALIRAFDHVLGLCLSNEAINSFAFECEKLAHGDPSGIDNTVATYGQAVLYCKGEAPPVQVLKLREFPPLVIAVSGVHSSTRDQVEAVRRRQAGMTAHYNAIFDEIGRISAEGADALVREDYRQLGMMMNVCHGLLNAIGVSTPELECMVDIARKNGAAGAKLTGAGGGGAIVALCPGAKNRVEMALRRAGYRVI